MFVARQEKSSRVQGGHELQNPCSLKTLIHTFRRAHTTKTLKALYHVLEARSRMCWAGAEGHGERGHGKSPYLWCHSCGLHFAQHLEWVLSHRRRNLTAVGTGRTFGTQWTFGYFQINSCCFFSGVLENFSTGLSLLKETPRAARRWNRSIRPARTPSCS